MRKLATIEKILDIKDIEGADNIQVATVRGWKVVIKKNEFKVGDLCVYFEIDSVLPKKEEFAFLEKSNYRIKTIKLKGQISQGLCLPLSILPEDIIKKIKEKGKDKIDIGYDVTEILGVTLYEPPLPISLSGDALGKFPTFIPKTDEERIQNIKDFEKFVKNKFFYVTEKLDGTSATYYINNGHFGVCSRNLELKESNKNIYWQIANKLNLKNILQSHKKNIAIQGEIVGQNIQKNIYNLSTHKFYIFSIYDINEKRYYTLNEMLSFCISYGLDIVPIITHKTQIKQTVDELIDMASTQSLLRGDIEKEGLVFRQTDIDEKISFKVLSNNYLLKQE